MFSWHGAAFHSVPVPPAKKTLIPVDPEVGLPGDCTAQQTPKLTRMYTAGTSYGGVALPIASPQSPEELRSQPSFQSR